MIDAGDVYLADIGGGGRRRVLVLTTSRFHRRADRAIVAPEITVGATGVQPPWRVSVGDALFALDALRTIDTDQLLERVDRAGANAASAARRALIAIT